MALFLSIILVWFLGLFFLRPKSSDLKAKIPTKWESFKKIQTTFWLGIVLCLVFLVSSKGAFVQIDDKWFVIFGVNNVKILTPWWLIQTFTHNFIHIDLLHLLTNLSFLGLLSLYERKVGAKRFLGVFLFSGVLSSISVLFASGPTVSAGASAGLLGLGAAYLLDNPKLTVKEYVIGVALIFFIYWMLRFQSEQGATGNYNIDEWGHILGLLSGAAYCKLFPKKSNQ